MLERYKLVDLIEWGIVFFWGCVQEGSLKILESLFQSSDNFNFGIIIYLTMSKQPNFIRKKCKEIFGVKVIFYLNERNITFIWEKTSLSSLYVVEWMTSITTNYLSINYIMYLIKSDYFKEIVNNIESIEVYPCAFII